jgi:hypothetical protein
VEAAEASVDDELAIRDHQAGEDADADQLRSKHDRVMRTASSTG